MSQKTNAPQSVSLLENSKTRGEGIEIAAYVKLAPPILIKRYEKNLEWYQRKKEKDFLYRLITNKEMNFAWRELSKHKRDECHAEKLFKEIVFIESQSRKPAVSRREEKKKFLEIAKQAQTLVRAITDGPLDKLVYEYFSAETMNSNGIENWENIGNMERNYISLHLLIEWPAFTDILKILEAHAIKLGDEAMIKKVTVERQKKGSRELYFVRELTKYVKSEYGSPLYGTIANISNAVLCADLTKGNVERMVRGSV